MSKGTFFTRQPVFNQILNFIPSGFVNAIARDHRADHYCKTFKTHEHLVTMLYAIFNQCTSIREVTTGLMAWEKRIHHLGIDRILAEVLFLMPIKDVHMRCLKRSI